MRIIKVHIDRFGALTDRTFEISPGFTLFYGPNECGKTSTMEFIRSTLVPSQQRNRYPKHSKTDSGKLIVEEDGRTFGLELSGRSRSGDVPDSIVNLDPNLFRMIFAMGASELDADDVISSGDIRSRFLMIPGGDVMPILLKEASDRCDAILGKTNRSNSELVGIDATLDGINAKIKGLKDSVAQYGNLDVQRKNLVDEEKRLRGLIDAENSSRVSVAVYESNQANINKLKELEDELNGLGEFPVAGYDEKMTYDRLSEKDRDMQEALQSAREDYRKSLDGFTDPEAIAADSEELLGLPMRYRMACSEKAAPAVQSGSKGMAAIGSVTAVAGVALSFYNIAGLVLVPIGIALVFLSTRKSKRTKHTESNDSDLERTVSMYMRRFGFEEKGIENDVRFLEDVARKAIRSKECKDRLLKAESDAAETSAALSGFLGTYGGDRGFEDAVSKTKRSIYLKERIESLRESLTNSGVNPDSDVRNSDFVPEDYQERLTEIGRRIGTLEAEMKRIMDSDELDRLIDQREAVLSRRSDILKRGAEAVLKKSICEAACGSAYEDVKPGVSQTADRYLSLMTSGRYRLVTDPRIKSISVSEGMDVKSLDKCSSGLRAQVLLSMKLAIAKEMGNGKIPMVLDDVLLPFDSERKAGAVKALTEISAEMQVLMFTCDRETYDLCTVEADKVRCLKMDSRHAHDI